MDKGHIEALDALKGVAILGVLTIHSGNNVPGGKLGAIQEAVISNGKMGVQIFFIISAMLIISLFLMLTLQKSYTKSC